MQAQHSTNFVSRKDRHCAGEVSDVENSPAVRAGVPAPVGRAGSGGPRARGARPRVRALRPGEPQLGSANGSGRGSSRGRSGAKSCDGFDARTVSFAESARNQERAEAAPSRTNGNLAGGVDRTRSEGNDPPAEAEAAYYCRAGNSTARRPACGRGQASICGHLGQRGDAQSLE